MIYVSPVLEKEILEELRLYVTKGRRVMFVYFSPRAQLTDLEREWLSTWKQAGGSVYLVMRNQAFEKEGTTVL
ncbi:hypothetical protein [Salsuginibacillus kocurii]|uniref:hypothetical protein n=1 Tax=Salsuginibacillus kocurii TaxID=427078 RepID=UPI00035DC9AA|nr:hypothetical protein [Salsuginibacillus kocurii]